MKKNTFIKYLCSSFGIVILVACALYMPKIYNDRQDAKNFNKVHTYEQDDISLFEKKNITAYDKIKDLIKIKEKLHEEDSNIYINELNEDVDKEYLLERIIEEVKRAADYGIIPDIIENYDISSGDCSFHCMEMGIYLMDSVRLRYWSVEFTDKKNDYNFKFDVDYDTYMIYRADLLCPEAKEWAHIKYIKGDYNYYELKNAYMQYYMAYDADIKDEDKQHIINLRYDDDYMSVIEGVLYDDTNAYGITINLFT